MTFFQVIYDATGYVVKWIFVTDGSVLGDNIVMSGEQDIWFLKTENGSIDSIVVKNAMIAIKR